mgnify:CR=1 FL=1
MAGGKRVVLLDADPNSHLLAWSTLRPAPTPNLRVVGRVTEEDILDRIRDEGGGADLILVDLEGTANNALTYATSKSHLVVVPAQSFQLTGWAEIEHTFRQPGPVSGQFTSGPVNGVTPPYAGQPIPGFSGMIPSVNAGNFYGLPDNGFGAQGNSADFVLGFYEVTPHFKTVGDGTTSRDYTFVDERLARHYGMAHVEGSRFRRVPVTDASRRGILGHASVLTLTSAPNRTSVVKRGQWVLETLLGTPPAPPPPACSATRSRGTNKCSSRS